MNLHGIVSPVISAVNPMVSATIKRSTGFTAQPDGTRIPIFERVPNVPLQVQSETYSDLQKLDGLNIQGVRRVAYAYGYWASVIRSLNVGGDLVVFPTGLMPEGRAWLLVWVLETWPDWCKFAITLQNEDKANDCP